MTFLSRCHQGQSAATLDCYARVNFPTQNSPTLTILTQPSVKDCIPLIARYSRPFRHPYSIPLCIGANS